LGNYVPESRVELHAEKALFRKQTELLRDLCDKQARHRKRQQFQFPDDPIVRTLFRSTPTSGHPSHAQGDNVQSTNKMTPEVRWLLTRSARMQRVNNAGFSTFQNRIKDKVVSADGRKRELSLLRQRSMCLRNERATTPRQQRLQCDVLGPKFCTDCTEIGQKIHTMKKQESSFPRIEVHTRSLVAPDKVEKIFLSNPKELFNQKKRYACGCTFDHKLEITTPLVYTPHEVFQRIRRRKQIEHEFFGVHNQAVTNDSPRVENRSPRPLNPLPSADSQSTERVPDSKAKVGSRAAITSVESRPSFVQEKTEPPMDLKVSVKFVNEG